MSSKVIETIVFPYAELSEKAKEKAKEWYDAGGWFRPDYIIEDAKAIGAIMGIDIDKVYYSGFYSQGDGACFEGSYAYQKGALPAIKAYAPNDTELHAIAAALQAAQKPNFYRIEASVKHSGHYYHSRCTDIEVYRNDDQYAAMQEGTEENIREILRDFMEWIYNGLEKEYDHQFSDETIAENMEGNEYTFTESGERFG